MKHIKPINEFNRTIGFRYSNPTIKFRLTLICIGDLDEESLSKLLNHLDITHENIKITSEENIVEFEHGQISTNLKIELEFFVYNENEIDKIIDELREGLDREFDVEIFNIEIKKAPILK
jgi:hypothetical protein